MYILFLNEIKVDHIYDTDADLYFYSLFFFI